MKHFFLTLFSVNMTGYSPHPRINFILKVVRECNGTEFVPKLPLRVRCSARTSNTFSCLLAARPGQPREGPRTSLPSGVFRTGCGFDDYLLFKLLLYDVFFILKHLWLFC